MGLLIGLTFSILCVEPDLIPDVNYKPKVGDRAVLYATDAEGKASEVWLTESRHGFRKYALGELLEEENEQIARIQKSMNNNRNSRFVYRGSSGYPIEQSGTPVLILEIEAPQRNAPLDLFDRLPPLVNVRILEGQSKGKSFFTPIYHITKLVINPKAILRAPVPNRNYKPKMGDRAVLFSPGNNAV